MINKVFYLYTIEYEKIVALNWFAIDVFAPKENTNNHYFLEVISGSSVLSHQ